MKLSVVATLYHSASYISEFCRRATTAAQQFAGEDYEIVLVNDGSPDDSLIVALEMANKDEHLIIVDLSRNFGHHKAMMTGLKHTSGDHVFLIDSDLEEEPELLLTFSEQMWRDKSDVVYGVQGQRKGNLFERWTGLAFYRIFRFLTGLNIPDNVVVARLMSRRYVNALLLHGEHEIFMAGLWVITGFSQSKQTIRKHSTSETTYTFRKKVSQLVNSITSFSGAPLVSIFFVGCVICMVSAAYAIFLVVNWLFLARPPVGYTSLMASVWLLGGMIIAFVGVIGIYLSKIYSEAKQRPYTIVRSVYGKKVNKEKRL
ncbi:undecaprenyl phosphate 4-deoxy-4-formamido-L-arabinose transferase [Burkholderiaceae bacterium]